ncbi:MAG: SMC-Scp complex subunit ScpB [Kiritimatiellae bacterium]|nr:SMC-Scp complex subunit ScpB [Kiritimatiellia bacterium]
MVEDTLPTLKQVVGALIFGSRQPISVREIRRCLHEVAQKEGGRAAAFANVTESEVRAAIETIAQTLLGNGYGFHLCEVAGGFRLQTDPACGLWLRYLLNRARVTRLSRPALESLAIIAYRQPVTRAEIESVRGVTVDHILKLLLEMQLIRIVGRSNLPGRPFLYGTTQTFLEYFGLRDLKELADIDPSLVRAASGLGQRARTESAAHRPAPVAVGSEPESSEGKTEDGTNENIPRDGQSGS